MSADNGTESPDDIVGHKTFRTGEIGESGFPAMRHEPLTRREADALWEHAKAKEAKRAADMPDEQSAINAMWEAYQRLRELGWREAMYCPKDGTRFRIVENGSTGIFEGAYQGEWPDGHWLSWDDSDAYCSSIAPALFRLFPEDETKEKARLEEARRRYFPDDAGDESASAKD